MKKEITYKSNDKITDIHAYIYEPTIEPKMIVQFSHGMLEHIEKYEFFADVLNKYGILFAGNDTLGHGASIIDKDHYGYFCNKIATKVLIDDTHDLTLKLKELYPNKKIILMGHSMGSFIARSCINEYSNDYNGLIITGSNYTSSIKANLQELTTSIIELYHHGEFYRSPYLKNYTCNRFAKKFEEGKTNPTCWINKNPNKINQYANPEYTKYSFTCNAYKTLFKLTKLANKKSKIKKINKDLPIFIMSGKDDPVGNFGKDIYTIQSLYKNAGIKNVSIKIFNNMRHDLLNDDNNVIVNNEIINFLSKI